MAIYEIKNDSGEVINTVNADEEFVKANFTNYSKKVFEEKKYTDKEALGRGWRNGQLTLSDIDPEHLPDHPKHDAWKAWRTALRDWPTTSEFPDTKPTKGY
tara:strand:+ start:767 stop:1069 length:303 start_codon:yes stop_codon:yes gene_type:complete